MITLLSRLAVAAVAVAMLGACATIPGGQRTAGDPFESWNRSVYKVNTAVDRVTAKPLAKAYSAVVPKPVRDGVSNVYNNLGEPLTMANGLLQGKPDVTMKSLGRLMINSTVGLGGLFDVASRWGVPLHEEDLGQTLAVWGVPDGPFLMVPILGPSNPRDLTGFVAEIVFDPTDYAVRAIGGRTLEYGLLGGKVIDLRYRLLSTFDKAIEDSEDPYATVRSAYIQRRRFEIRDGAPEIAPEQEDIFSDTVEPAPVVEATPGGATPQTTPPNS